MCWVKHSWMILEMKRECETKKRFIQEEKLTFWKGNVKQKVNVSHHDSYQKEENWIRLLWVGDYSQFWGPGVERFRIDGNFVEIKKDSQSFKKKTDSQSLNELIPASLKNPQKPNSKPNPLHSISKPWFSIRKMMKGSCKEDWEFGGGRYQGANFSLHATWRLSTDNNFIINK